MTPYQTKNEFRQALRLERLGAWLMSLICGLLVLLAFVTAGRLPIYLATLDYARFGGVILFNLLALAGLGFNVYHHRCLRRLAK